MIPTLSRGRYLLRRSLSHQYYLASSRRYNSTSSYLPPSLFQISPEIQDAVHSNSPVVALETTIYTHGFPFPDNVALASLLESVVRLNGGVPATIGVLNGVARVGLNPEELIELAEGYGKRETMKISRRDLPYVTGLGMAGKKLNGGTTIAGTMILAHMAGIEVFGTGGLGGVHRGGEVTMDISADLTELGRTPVVVISSGCKSFLDIPRTLEYLETQGVGVGTFADGRTGNIDLPAFWTRNSGIKSPSVVQDETEAAAIIYARGLLNMQSGLFFANPIPEEHSIPKAEIDQAILEAVQDANQKGISGHANTPFILARIKELTQGRSIPANRALIESNVARATKVAVELSKLKSGARKNDRDFMPAAYSSGGTSRISGIGLSNSPLISPKPLDSISPFPKPDIAVEADILVAGSVAVDLSCDFFPTTSTADINPVAHTSNPALISQSIGGVGHNVATAAQLIDAGTSVRLCSLIADDLAGGMILSSLEERHMDTTAIRTLRAGVDGVPRTAQYVAVNDANKDLVLAMADMSIISSRTTDFSLWQSVMQTSKPKWVVVDANWDHSVMFQWIRGARNTGAHVAFEPVSVAKSSKLFNPRRKHLDGKANDLSADLPVFPSYDVELATPNKFELAAMHDAAKSNGYLERQDWWAVIDAMGIPSAGIGLQLQNLTNRKLVDEGIPQRMIQLLPFIPVIITKLGAKGVVLARLLPPDHPLLRDPEEAPYILSRSTNDNPDIGGVYMRFFPAAETVTAEEIVSVNGVGDTFLGALVAGLAKGLEYDGHLIDVAQKAAVLTLKSSEAVSPDLRGLAAELERVPRMSVLSDH